MKCHYYRLSLRTPFVVLHAYRISRLLVRDIQGYSEVREDNRRAASPDSREGYSEVSEANPERVTD